MKITATTNVNSVAITYGFIGFKFDFSEMETSIKTFRTIVKNFIPIDKKHLTNLNEKTEQIIKFVRIFNKCIQIESKVTDWETIMEIDIDDETLIGKAKFLKLPIQDKDMVITIDYMAIGNLIKELSVFNIMPTDTEENTVSSKEEKSKPIGYSSIEDMENYLKENNITNESEAMEILSKEFPTNRGIDYQIAIEYTIKSK